MRVVSAACDGMHNKRPEEVEMYFSSSGRIESIVPKEGRFVITFLHERHADEAVRRHASSRDWNVQYGDWKLEPPAPPRATVQRRPSGALGAAAGHVLEAPPSALDEGDISPSGPSSGLRKTSAAARGFNSRGEESGANRKKTVLGIGGEHHESLQTEFQFPDALEIELAAQRRPEEQTRAALAQSIAGQSDEAYGFCVEINQRAALAQALRQAAARPLTASVPSRDAGDIRAVSRRLSGVSVGGSKSADVETAEDDSLRVVLPPKPSSTRIEDLEAAGDILWAVYEKTKCTEGARKLKPDGTPLRMSRGNGESGRRQACVSGLVLFASMVKHAGGLASNEGWKQSDLRSKDVDTLLNDAHTLAKKFNDLDPRLRAPGALKSGRAFIRENEAQKEAEIEEEVKAQRAAPTFNRDEWFFDYYERDENGDHVRDQDGNLVRATVRDDGVNIWRGTMVFRRAPKVVSPCVVDDGKGAPWVDEVDGSLGGVQALKTACDATVRELFAPGAIGDLAAAKYFNGHGESTDTGRCARAGTKSDGQARDCIGIYCDNAELFYVQEEGLDSIRFDPSAFQHLDPEGEEYKNRKLASRLVPFIRQGFVRYHVDSGHFVYAGPYWDNASVLREARARDEERSGVRGCAGRASQIRKSVPTLGSVITVVMIKGVAHGCKLPASMWCKYGYNVMMRLRGGADLEAESEAERVKFAEAWAAQMRKCKAGKETRSIQIDFRSQFATGHARDEHYFSEPMDLGVLQPDVFTASGAAAVLAPSLPGRRSSTSSCPELYNFLVAADTLVPGPTGGRLRSADGLRHFLSGEPSRSSVFFAGDFRFRLGGGEWVRKEEWPGDQF